MTTYNDIITEQGFLSSKGKVLIQAKFLLSVQELLSIGKTDNEIRIISGVLSNIIGKTVTDLIQGTSTPETKDAEQEYSFIKYGNNLVDPFDNQLSDELMSKNKIKE